MSALEALWEFIKQRPDAVSIAVGVAAAIAGYIGKHISDIRARRFDARLAFVTSQLRDLYGPLYLLSGANDQTWHEFRQRFRPGRQMFDAVDPLTMEEKREYVRWLEVAFVPCNTKMRTIIEGNAHLFVGGKVPPMILQLLAHFDELGVVLSKLKDGSDDNVFPGVMYPTGFAQIIRQNYETIANNHARMTASRQ